MRYYIVSPQSQIRVSQQLISLWSTHDQGGKIAPPWWYCHLRTQWIKHVLYNEPTSIQQCNASQSNSKWEQTQSRHLVRRNLTQPLAISHPHGCDRDGLSAAAVAVARASLFMHCGRLVSPRRTMSWWSFLFCAATPKKGPLSPPNATNCTNDKRNWALTSVVVALEKLVSLLNTS